jgi:pimeloyl-ACP methyl ester carboxylesterase
MLARTATADRHHTVEQPHLVRRSFVLVAAAMVIVIAGCGGDDRAKEGRDAVRTPSATITDSAGNSAPRGPDGDASTDDRLLNVGGHKLFIACRGTRSPTIVYLHGMGGSAASAGTIPSMFGDRQRVCVYDRLNSTGLSDHVDGPLTGKDQVQDLHGLLAAADVPSPYVLLGASHGGLIAGMYAGMYPDDVAGMVLLDSPAPDTFKYERRYLPKDALPKRGGWRDSPELLDDWTTIRQAQVLQRRAPRIPVTYIAAKHMELPPSYPRKAITAAERRLHRDYLKRFSPARYVLVDSPHFMEPAIPDRIVREVKRLIAASTGS